MFKYLLNGLKILVKGTTTPKNLANVFDEEVALEQMKIEKQRLQKIAEYDSAVSEFNSGKKVVEDNIQMAKQGDYSYKKL